MNILQAKNDNDVVDQVLGSWVHSNQRTKISKWQVTKIPSSSIK